ncbi:hypothetical protein HKBW3S03_01280 [Candidatus Hakubella thermalkaliphila]|uniref:Glycosyl transferase family 1 domain-containing protein n=3 Tax=Candidatus Hakubella thermalkaliphila TaxID=2754717 RepID=A0A6V8Q6J3_9ACTN|nr:D-inositol 3-phosphate glycosyltransferase [Bacillota bacterium]GFP19776.1 hypothetical protein HKBW3S03_01280 [Candidatus Hakubella thermalkaliphila]GFP30942.1 hypothetical protein HKBW3S34_01861 [Candidatus Hakubella thermalkaliphila]GFP39704.1 hypothetical protein HKBW3S47_01402 [Candidatus Hakubella thermalkaliphila]GFP42341.1 hypothetical protein HKBW3C_01467 [Candidatus Hakubella thermalkaliphila]
MKLVVAGQWLSPRLRKAFEQNLTKRGFHRQVEVIGPVSQKKLIELYLRARVLVHPFREAFGMTVLEAAGCGCPFLVAEGSGVCDLFEHGKEGFFVEENDIDTWARNVGKLAADERLAWAMGQSAWEVARQHTWRDHTLQLLQVIKRKATRGVKGYWGIKSSTSSMMSSFQERSIVKPLHTVGKDCPYNETYLFERDFLPQHLTVTIERLLRTAGAWKVLDVGCGSGRLIYYLRERGYLAVGCDISFHAALMSQQIVGAAEALPFPSDEFDFVVGISLIEHLTPILGEVFVDEAFRILRPSGGIFLVTPNYMSPMRIIKGAKWYGYQDLTHVTFYTPMTVRKLLLRKGFRQIRFTFPSHTDSTADWTLPQVIKLMPKTVQKLVNCVLISSPLALLRDSLWVSASKCEVLT